MPRPAAHPLPGVTVVPASGEPPSPPTLPPSASEDPASAEPVSPVAPVSEPTPPSPCVPASAPAAPERGDPPEHAVARERTTRSNPERICIAAHAASHAPAQGPTVFRASGRLQKSSRDTHLSVRDRRHRRKRRGNTHGHAWHTK